MSDITCFSSAPDERELPTVFPNPFGNTPHPLARQAAAQMQETLLSPTDWEHDFDAVDGGKVFAVLVVRKKNNQIGFLSAFAGMLAGQWTLPGFVPPIFDGPERAQLFSAGGMLLSSYALGNWRKEKKAIGDFFTDRHLPHGVGDCAAPKLIHFAQQHELRPLAMAEFWWGAPPSGQVRHHGHYYPACRGKCHPILPFMLEGIDVQPLSFSRNRDSDDVLITRYEDDDLVVVNKPAGLLSVPGKEVRDSVLTRLKKCYPHATGPLLVHRLDMATSGLLLAAKNTATHKALQQQFEQRSVEKCYVAVLSKRLPEHQSRGTIELPLRVDIDDRPRQMVCFNHGKPAKTHWEIISRQQASTRVYFYPLTGRTHQLRVHAAHQDGLDAPIVGDALYGTTAERMLLHAERLGFTHPVTGEQLEVEAPVPF